MGTASFLLLFCVTGLSVETSFPGITLLRVDIESLVLDVMIPFFVFPVYILGFVDLSYAGFKDQGVVNSRNTFCFKDVLERSEEHTSELQSQQ